jgi:four helix bundle protein
MAIQSYKQLTLWTKAMDLAELLYKSTGSFPKEETYGITSQLRRSAVSIPSNIAEGYSRNTKGEYIQFLGIAKGSLCELETQVMLAERFNYLSNIEAERLLSLSTEVGKLLTTYIQNLRKS